MDQTGQQYTGLMAQFWDLFRGDSAHWADRFLFKAAVSQSGQPVLDVGCGTGRLLLELLAESIDIDGVDNSPEMLDLCRQKAAKLGLTPQVYLQPMEALELPRQYRTILVPSGSFQILIDRSAAQAALRRFFAHLCSGGQLVISFYELWTGQRAGPIAHEEWMREVVRPEDGALVRRWTHATYDLVNNLEHTANRYDVIRNGEVIASQRFVSSPATRGYTQAEAQQIVHDAGFRNIQITGNHTQKAVQATDTFFNVWGTKP